MVKVGADVVESVQGASVDIRRIQLSADGQSLGQRHSSLAELPEPAGGVAQAQASKSEQLAPSGCPCSHLDTAALDKGAIVVVQRAANQRHSRLGLVRGITEPAFHRLRNDIVGQRRRILERPVRVRHQAKLRQPPTAPRANEANVA